MIIIGSSAIRYWYQSFPRNPKDLDVILEEGEECRLDGTYPRVEVLRNPVLLKYHMSRNKYAYPDELYTLKMSHLFWDINWDKHMWDLHFLKSKECSLKMDMFLELYEYWNKVHGANKRSDLKMPAEDFFNNALKCEHDHDWLHTLITPTTPMFNKVLKDNEEVEVDEEKFKKLTNVEKDLLVREEVMVMAYERYPNMLYKNAYGRMLKKFIISHAPMWEAIYIIENYVRLVKIDFNFIKHLNEQISKSDNPVKRPTGFVK